MDKFMDNRWFLRGFALLLAVLMFVSVSENPLQTISSNSSDDVETIESVPVEAIYDQEVLAVSGVPSTVDVTIEGPTQVVQQAKAARDFRIFLDLRDYEIGSHTVPLQSEGFSNRLRVTLSNPSADVAIDERVTEEFTVDPEFNASVIAEGFEVDEISVSPQTVEITGAKSVIESIRYVRATFNTEGTIEEEETIRSAVQVLDQDLNKLPVTVDPANVDVTMSVTRPGREVSLVPEQTGSLEDGLTLESIELSDDAVTIFGPQDVIDEIDQITVPFDLSGITQSGSRIEVPIPLPEGVERLSKRNASAVVVFGNEEDNNEDNDAADTEEPLPNEDDTAQSGGEPAEPSAEPDPETDEDTGTDTPVTEEDEEVAESTPPEEETEEPQTGERTLSALPVEVRGTGDDLRTTFTRPPGGELELQVSGEASEIEQLSEEDVSLYVDTSSLEEGEHELEVQIEGPPDVTYILSQPTITIELTQT